MRKTKKQIYLGIDAGYSATVRSTGVCVIAPGSSNPVYCLHVKTEHTIAAINKLLGAVQPTSIAIDGPLVIDLSPEKVRYKTINHYRNCERMLSGGIFQKRCKPGPTNSPRGQALHKQSTFLANHFISVFPNITISESFPNAFMGVMLPEKIFQAPIRRGIKSDVFWEYCVKRSHLMQQLLTHLFGKHGETIFQNSHGLLNHDERAAFICALTACAVSQNKVFWIDGGIDGAIALPPKGFMQPWAKMFLMPRAEAN